MSARRGRPQILLPPAIVEGVRAMIAGRAGHPCPDNRLMAAALGISARSVRDAIELLEAGGELEIQRSAFVGGLRRRIRVKVRGRWRGWTGLTKRGAYDLRITAPDLLKLINTHHLARVLIAGRYD